MTKKLFGLGKGLGSLIPSKKETHIAPQQSRESVFYIETNKVKPNPQQPRKQFDNQGIKELAASIKKYGILQPLLVTKTEKQTSRGMEVEYYLLAGERRWRAARFLSMLHVPAMVKDSIIEDRARLEMALIENLQREDLNPLEEAMAYKRFANEFNLTQKEIAEKVSKSREVVGNALRLLDLSSDIQESLRAGKLSRTQARTLLAFKNSEQREEAYKQMVSGVLSVREAEQRARLVKSTSPLPKENRFQDLEKNLGKIIGTSVFIRAGSNGGKILIKFTNLEELNKIVKKILD